MPSQKTPAQSKPFTPLQKIGIIAGIVLAGSAIWFLSSGQASTTIDLTLTTNPDLEHGLVGHWTFDGPDVDWSSTTAEIKDRSGQGNHGNATTAMTSAKSPTMGKIGQGMSFDGVSDYVNMSTVNIPGNTTFSAWVNASTWDYSLNHSSTAGVVVKGSWASDAEGDVRVIVKGTELVVDINLSTGRQESSYLISNLSISTWYHVTGTWDGSDLKLYINGVERDSNTYSGSFNNNNRSVWVGAYNNNESGTPFSGSIDDVRIYNRALSPSEVKRLYGLGAGSH